MNKFIAIGRTTKDIEIKKTSNSKEYAIFQLAVTRPYSNQKEIDFISCKVWNKQAIVLQKYCQKGSQIAISGILQSYKNKDNKTERIVQISNYEFLHTNNNLKKKKKDIFLSDFSDKNISKEQVNYSSKDIKEFLIIMMQLNEIKPLYIYNNELHKYSISIPSVSKIVNILVPKDFLQIDENILKLAQTRGICLHNMIDCWIKNNFDDELIEFIDCDIKSHRELFKNFTKLYQETFKDIKFKYYETWKNILSFFIMWYNRFYWCNYG